MQRSCHPAKRRISDVNATSIPTLAQKRFTLFLNPTIRTTREALSAMDYIWTPWRYQYMKQAESNNLPECIFCDAANRTDDTTP